MQVWILETHTSYIGNAVEGVFYTAEEGKSAADKLETGIASSWVSVHPEVWTRDIGSETKQHLEAWEVMGLHANQD